MSHQIKEQDSSRRSFLKAAAVTAAAATVTGAGAALLRTEVSPAPMPAAPPVPPAPAVVYAANDQAIADMFAQLAAVQAENVRLQAKLDATQRQLKSEQGDNSQVEAMSLELGKATQQIGVLSGLVALYEQLDEIDLAQALGQGLANVSGSIAEMVSGLPTLSEGIEAGQQALDELEAQIPILESGRRWLNEHTETLHTYYQAVERLLEEMVDAAAPFLVMLNRWFQDILKWLPFGLGQRASEIMQVIAALLIETPQTISGLNHHIVRPLDGWLGEADGEVPLRQNLVKPLREQVLQRTSQTVAQARQVQQVYQAQVTQPADSLTQRQHDLRQLIADYRQLNHIT